MNYWLFKNEPDAYGVDDLDAESDKTTSWNGVRNYQARNFMRDDMKKGDKGFFYHSNCDIPAVVGIVEIVREAYVDHTAFDSNDKYFDAKSDPENPRWFMVDVKLVRKLKRPIPLREVKEYADKLEGFRLIAKGNRLSVMPVEPAHWKLVLSLENK
ncbi:MAG TPA: EVE domain-containing protein [Xanthomonadales bacterium]|nr:EVE domain-containing protein [Xanthomonadales bacterium]